MTFRRFVDSFRSGADLVYVAKEFVPEYVPTACEHRFAPARASARLTARGSVNLSRFGVSTSADIAKRKERVLAGDFSVD